MRDLFDKERFPPALEEALRDWNPWWEGKPGRPTPPFRRWAFGAVLRKFETRLAPAVVLRGPRRVGKTTIIGQVIDYFIREKGFDPRRILWVPFDEIGSLKGLTDPILSIARWFENRILGRTFNEAANAGEEAYLLLDEVQNLKGWAPQLKNLVDTQAVRVMVTGSSALRISLGEDSLAGRLTTVEMGPLLLREIAALRGFGEIGPVLPSNGLRALLDRQTWTALVEHGRRHRKVRDDAFRAFSDRGGYPMAQSHADVPWPEVADQLNREVIRRVIEHDLRMGDRGRRRDKNLLEEVFGLSCRYTGQAPGQDLYIQEIKRTLGANVGWGRILTYLKFLDGSLLLRLVEPLEIRIRRRKGNPKLCIADHALRAAWIEESIPLAPAALEAAPYLSDLAGHIAESVVGAHLVGIPNLDVAHMPARGADPEVDYVFTVGEHRVPVEVKYRRTIDPVRDTHGLRAFLEKAVYHAPFGLLVTMNDDVRIDDPRIIPVSLPDLLLLR